MGFFLKQLGERDFDYIRKERLYNLRRKCEKVEEVKLIKKEVLVKKLGYIIVNDQYKVLFCYILKVVCINMKRVFFILIGQMNIINLLVLKSKDVYMSLDKYLIYLDLYSDKEVVEKFRIYKKFIFVREFLERLLSAYRNKFIEKSVYFYKRFGRRIVRKFRDGVNKSQEIQGNDVTFLEFVRYIIDENTMENEGFNEYWVYYFVFCYFCYV